MEFKNTDKVTVIGDTSDHGFYIGACLTIIGHNENQYAASDGIINRWIDKVDIELYQPDTTNTYLAFNETLLSLEKQHVDLLHLQLGHTGDLSMAYGSLAANTLTSISIIKHIYNIYTDEYF